MQSNIKEVWIKNFKSYKELKLPLNDFNVLIGPNASGKTNLIEFFKFFKNAVDASVQPRLPYLDWWTYGNIVWRRDETLPITGGIKIDCNGYTATYEATFSGAGGAFKTVREFLSIDGIVSIEKEGQILRIKHDKKFIEINAEKLKKMLLADRPSIFGKSPDFNSLAEQELVLDIQNLFDIRLLWGHRFSYRTQELFLDTIVPDSFPKGDLNKRLQTSCPVIATPSIKIDAQGIKSVCSHIFNEFRKTISNFTLLRPLNMTAIRTPFSPKKEVVLNEDGSNLCNQLYGSFLDKNRIPKRIEAALNAFFPGTQIAFQPTEDGRVFMKIYENGLELHPPSVSDGFYKMLAVLMAIESKPAFLAIDEIETSLHAKVLEYVIDELKGSGITVILSTHASAVLDMITPEDLVIAEKTVDEGTKLKRIKDPDKVREQLHKAGITQSESWLYGKLE